MARSRFGTPGPRARHGLAVLSVGMVLMLTGPAWSGSREEPTKFGVDPKSEVEAISGVSHIAVEPGTLESLAHGSSALVPSGSFVSEVEPNDTSAAAQALTLPARVRGKLYRLPFVAGLDVDIYSFTAAAGDRVFAATMTGFSGGDTDTLIDIIGIDGTTVIETDDDDGGIASLASSLAGTLLPTGRHLLRARASLQSHRDHRLGSSL